MTHDEKTLLIVDDDPITRLGFGILIKDAFEPILRRPLNVLYASDGQEALEVLADTPVDLVISDTNMPGIDGITFLDRFKAVGYKAKFVLLFSNSLKFPQLKKKDVEALGADYIYTKDEFLQSVIRVCLEIFAD